MLLYRVSTGAQNGQTSYSPAVVLNEWPSRMFFFCYLLINLY